MNQVYLGLGSNIGDRLGHLRGAVEQLVAQSALHLPVASSVYETEAHLLEGADAQPAYFNAVLGVKTSLSPRDLLKLVNQIEREEGRNRVIEKRWESRTLDIDILAYADQTLRSRTLQIPHPWLGDRSFVLVPWNDVAPDFLVPAPFNATVKDLLAGCKDPGHLAKTSYNLLD